MKTISIVGNIGLKSSDHGGQTIKTKIIANELIKHYGIDNVGLIDTDGNVFIKFLSIIRFMLSFFYSKNIIMLPAHNSLRIFLPIGVILKKMFNRKYHYIVIGGWLPSILTKNKRLLKKIKSVDYIYVETSLMKRQLNDMGLNNIFIMPNFKENIILSPQNLKYQKSCPFSICTFSRITPKKGIEDIINAVIKINKKYKKVIFKLDLYGQIDDGYESWFSSLKDSFPSYINYCGVIDYNSTTDVLKNYFLLIFPTKFFTEGIPGTIIDSFSAGIPVLASKWESFDDVIVDSVTGFETKFGNEELYKDLENLYVNYNSVNKLKTNCLKEAEKYLVSNCITILFNNIEG